MARRHEDPAPKPAAVLPERWRTASADSVRLQVEDGPDTTFKEVMDARQTIREMRPASRDRVGTLLWYAARTRSLTSGKERRPSPSAGGLHPMDIVMMDVDGPCYYDPVRHALGRLEVPNPLALMTSVRAADRLVETAAGTLLLFAGDIARVGAAYENPGSLLWRDAGCVIATMQLVATWLRLAALPLGILGGDLVDALGLSGVLEPLGVMLVGEPTA